MKKTYSLIIFLLAIAILIPSVLAGINDPTGFGNSTARTAYIGGTQGIVNATGNITGGDFYYANGSRLIPGGSGSGSGNINTVQSTNSSLISIQNGSVTNVTANVTGFQAWLDSLYAKIPHLTATNNTLNTEVTDRINADTAINNSLQTEILLQASNNASQAALIVLLQNADGSINQSVVLLISNQGVINSTLNGVLVNDSRFASNIASVNSTALLALANALSINSTVNNHTSNIASINTTALLSLANAQAINNTMARINTSNVIINAQISCMNITGNGSDTDFCTDASGGVGSNPEVNQNVNVSANSTFGNITVDILRIKNPPAICPGGNTFLDQWLGLNSSCRQIDESLFTMTLFDILSGDDYIIVTGTQNKTIVLDDAKLNETVDHRIGQNNTPKILSNLRVTEHLNVTKNLTLEGIDNCNTGYSLKTDSQGRVYCAVETGSGSGSDPTESTISIPFQYNESLTVTKVDMTAGVFMNMNISSVLNAKYLVLAHALYKMNLSSIGSNEINFREGTSDILTSAWLPTSIDDVRSIGFYHILNGTGNNISINLEANSLDNNYTILNSSIMSIRLDNLNNSHYNYTYNATTINNVNNIWGDNPTDSMVLTFKPSTDGYYLILATAAVSSAGPVVSVAARLNVNGEREFIPALNGTEASFSYFRCEEEVTASDGCLFYSSSVRFFNTSEQNISLQFADGDGTADADIQKRELIVVRLSDVFNFSFVSNTGYVNTSSTTFENISTLSLSEKTGSYFILNNMNTLGNSTSEDYENALLEGSNRLYTSRNRPKDVANILGSGFGFHRNISAPITYANQYRREDTTAYAFAKNSEIVAILLYNKTYTAGSGGGSNSVNNITGQGTTNSIAKFLNQTHLTISKITDDGTSIFLNLKAFISNSATDGSSTLSITTNNTDLPSGLTKGVSVVTHNPGDGFLGAGDSGSAINYYSLFSTDGALLSPITHYLANMSLGGEALGTEYAFYVTNSAGKDSAGYGLYMEDQKTYSIYTNAGAVRFGGSLLLVTNLTMSGLKNCNTIDTDSNGVFICGTDADNSALVQANLNSEVTNKSNNIASMNTTLNAAVVGISTLNNTKLQNASSGSLNNLIVTGTANITTRIYVENILCWNALCTVNQSFNGTHLNIRGLYGNFSI